MNSSQLGHGTRSLRWGRAAAVVAALSLIVTACSTTDTTTGSGSSGASSYLSAAQISQLETLVEQASAVPKFVPPGPAFDTSKLQGKKIFAMPTASQLPVCNQIADDIVKLAGKFGMTGKNFQNSGGPSAWIPGIQQAISQHYDAIVLVCGIDPNLIKPQLQAGGDHQVLPQVQDHVHRHRGARLGDEGAVRGQLGAGRQPEHQGGHPHLRR